MNTAHLWERNLDSWKPAGTKSVVSPLCVLAYPLLKHHMGCINSNTDGLQFNNFSLLFCIFVITFSNIKN